MAVGGGGALGVEQVDLAETLLAIGGRTWVALRGGQPDEEGRKGGRTVRSTAAASRQSPSRRNVSTRISPCLTMRMPGGRGTKNLFPVRVAWISFCVSDAFSFWEPFGLWRAADRALRLIQFATSIFLLMMEWWEIIFLSLFFF